jgi:hypothetical protein
MTPVRAVAVIGASALFTVLLGWLARAPYDPPGAGGLLRLSWRFRGERIENCRQRTQAELDALPVHMRTPEVCDGRNAAYELIVQVDDQKADTMEVKPGGARGDRPVFVLRDVPLSPGPHRVRVRFGRPGAESGEAALALDTRMQAEPNRIELITLDADADRLLHVRRPSSDRE